MEDPVLISPQVDKDYVIHAMLLSIVFQVFFNKLDQEQRN